MGLCLEVPEDDYNDVSLLSTGEPWMVFFVPGNVHVFIGWYWLWLARECTRLSGHLGYLLLKWCCLSSTLALSIWLPRWIAWSFFKYLSYFEQWCHPSAWFVWPNKFPRLMRFGWLYCAWSMAIKWYLSTQPTIRWRQNIVCVQFQKVDGWMTCLVIVSRWCMG